MVRDIILADCYVCGRETDAYDGDPHPRCMSCFDKGLSARWAASKDPERIAKAKKLYSEGMSVIHIAATLKTSRQMVRVWIGLQNGHKQGDPPSEKSGTNATNLKPVRLDSWR